MICFAFYLVFIIIEKKIYQIMKIDVQGNEKRKHEK